MKREQISVFDMFKIGIGPSSSHTLGPWRAAQQFVQLLNETQVLPKTAEIKILPYGPLAKTGHGHGTDIAIVLGLSGDDPVTFNVSAIDDKIAGIKATGQLSLGGAHDIPFSYEHDLLFLYTEVLPFRPIAVTFQALLHHGSVISRKF